MFSEIITVFDRTDLMTTAETLSNTIAVLRQPKTKLYDIEDILQLSCYILMSYVQTLTGKNDSMNQGKL